MIITAAASEDNNNQSQEAAGANEENECQIGVAPEGYNIHESVLYTHRYFVFLSRQRRVSGSAPDKRMGRGRDRDLDFELAGTDNSVYHLHVDLFS